jgi:uncharacterized protein YegP (UPF0339 family)
MFEIFANTHGQPCFRLLAHNGEIILASESYTSLAACEGGIASVKANAGKPAQFEIRSSADDRGYFVLKGENGEIIGTSETYDSDATLQKGIASVVANAGGAVKNTIA